MRRAAALLAAVAMVVGAYALRTSLQDDDGETGDQASGGTIVCADDLAQICRTAGIEIAATRPAGATADVLIAADNADALGGSAWLTTSAWASLVQAERDRANAEALFGVAGEPLASSPVVLAVWEDRAAQLADLCGLTAEQPVGWRCLAEQSGVELAGRDFVRTASPEVDTATGLVVAAAQTSGLLGLTEYASNDFDSGDFRTLAGRASAGQVAAPVSTMLTRGPGAATAAGAIGADARDLPPRFGTRIVAREAEPPVRADVVLVVPAGRSVSEEDRRRLADALLAAGWDPPADGPAGLPDGGVLAAIRTLWSAGR